MQTKNLFNTKEHIDINFPKYALALVNITGLGVKTFSYLIPDEMKHDIKLAQLLFYLLTDVILHLPIVNFDQLYTFKCTSL